jgi:hypothetical protein
MTDSKAEQEYREQIAAAHLRLLKAADRIRNVQAYVEATTGGSFEDRIREAAKLLEAEGYELVRKENIRKENIRELSCSNRMSKSQAEDLVNNEHARYVARAYVESLVHSFARELKEVAVLHTQDDPEYDCVRYTIRLRCIVEDAYPDVRPDQSSTPVKRGLEDIIFEQLRNLGLTARP